MVMPVLRLIFIYLVLILAVVGVFNRDKLGELFDDGGAGADVAAALTRQDPPDEAEVLSPPPAAPVADAPQAPAVTPQPVAPATEPAPVYPPSEEELFGTDESDSPESVAPTTPEASTLPAPADEPVADPEPVTPPAPIQGVAMLQTPVAQPVEAPVATPAPEPAQPVVATPSDAPALTVLSEQELDDKRNAARAAYWGGEVAIAEAIFEELALSKPDQLDPVKAKTIADLLDAQ